MTPRTDTTAPPGLHPEHFRHLAHEAVDLVADYLAGIAAGPVPASVPRSCWNASAPPSCRTRWATVIHGSSAG